MSQLSPLTVSGNRRGSIVTVTLLIAALLTLSVQQAPPAQAAVAAKFAPAVVPVGSGVTIGGEGLAGTTGVTFLGTADPADDVAAEHFIALDAKKLVVQVPEGAVSGPLALTDAGGTTPSAGSLTIVQRPTISSLSAPSGAPGTTFTINGDNLLGTKKPKVLIGGKGAGAATLTQTAVEVKVPGLVGGPHELKLITDGGMAKSSFYIAPTVKGATPAFGTSAGGSVVTIKGTGFTGVDKFVDDPATPAIDETFNGVTIGGVNVTALIAVNDKEVVVRTPAGVDLAAPIVVSTTDGSVVAASTSPATFQYRPLPSVSAMVPDWNEVGVPAEVTLTGQNLNETTTVSVNGLPVSGQSADPVAGTLTFTPPAIAKAGAAKLVLTNTEGGVAYAVTVPFNVVTTPIVSKLVPSTGAAGKDVLVNGAGFTAGTTVTFGGAAATCKVVNYGQLSCTAPNGVADGPANVVATNPVGSSADTATSVFTYDAAGSSTNLPSKLAPAVKGLAPAYGTTGSTVTLKGSNLHTVTRVQFTGPDSTWVDASEYLPVGPGLLVVKVPAGAVSGQLRVTNPDGVVESDAKVLSRTVAPRVTSLDAVGDQTYGVTPNDFLTIRGSGLFIKGAKTLVTIGGLPAGVLARPRPTPRSITVKVPAAIGGRQEVVVSTPLGTATAETNVYYLPELKAGKPLSTSRTGGTVVTVTGLGFTGVDGVSVGGGRESAVKFGGVAVQKMVYMSDKALVAVTAAGSASADELVVRTQHDGRVGDSEGDVKALGVASPTIGGVSPNTTRAASATAPVTITGTNLSLATNVTFGGDPATVQSAAVDGTSIVVLPPVRSAVGAVTVKVENVVDGDAVSDSLTNGFTYTTAAATVSSVSSSTAPAGTTVTILGTGFYGVTSVSFGATPATSYTVANANTIYATVPLTPSGAQGATVNVTVVNSTGVASTGDTATADDWTWNGNPVITGMSAHTGNEGTTVTITGTGFTGSTGVRFGSLTAVRTIVNDTTITATVPVSPSLGATADVTVVGAGGATQAPLVATVNDWTWTPVANITGISILNGVMTITGTNLTAARTVLLDNGTTYSVVSAPFTTNTATSLSFTLPASPGGNLKNSRGAFVINGSGAQSTATARANYFNWP